jgi:SAM-dependent methyltransferase
MTEASHFSDKSHVPGFDPDDAWRIATAVARLVPPALAPALDAGFTHSHALYDEFIYRLTIRVLEETGLAPVGGEWASAEDIVTRAGLDARRARAPVSWMLAHLAGRGWLAREEGAAAPRFRAERALPDLDPAAVLAEQQRHDPACLPSYVLAETAARDYPAFLRGGPSGEEILFAPRRLALWTGYFSNDNNLYAINNRVGAVALDAWMPGGGSTVLELGGGLGSGAAAAIERLAASGRLDEVRQYRFTELVQAFLRRGERFLTERYSDAPLSFAPLDMNRPFEGQGVAPASVSIVYAVNTLHVAHDLAVTLGEVRRALEPGGQIIISECIRPWPGQTLYPEFVFNLLETFRSPRLHPAYRPNGGFLTPEQWSAALHATGFVDVRVLPDIARVRDVHATFYVAAVGATRPA